MRPKKSLGQHFLTDINILDYMVAAAQIAPGEMVVEVGPGTGTLTDRLLSAGARVIAIEKDHELVYQLKEKYKNNENIEIIDGDILHYSPFAIHYSLVGNLPYYLTSHLLKTVLTSWPQPRCMVFMVQKEVAQRMAAKPPNMSMLAVLVQTYCDVEILRTVKQGSFRPAPKVDSAIIKLGHSDQWIVDSEKILDIAARGFAQPRKKLRNNLPAKLLAKAGIDPDRRAETLTIDEWQTLAGVV